MERLRPGARAPLLILAVLLIAAACKRVPTPEDAPIEEPFELLSAFDVSDPRAAVQMTSGFHALEGGSWRWTASRFTVVLAPPPDATERGARLELGLNIPEALIGASGPVTLSVGFDGGALRPETFAEPGGTTFVRELSPRQFTGEPVMIEFRTDKTLPPEADARELSLIVTRVALVAQ